MLTMLFKIRYRVASISIAFLIWTVYWSGKTRILLYLSEYPSKTYESFIFSQHEAHIKTELETSPTALSALCSQTKWVDGLWLHCHSYSGLNRISVAGGLNNARNRIQTCIRLAIDAGSGLIIPPVSTLRDSTNWVTGQTESFCPDVYWNIEYLKTQLSKQCPQLQLRSCGNTSEINSIVRTIYRQYEDPTYHLGTFRSFVATTLREAKASKPNKHNLVAVEFGDSYLAFNYSASGEMGTVRRDLFKLLKFNQRLLEISETILRSTLLRHGFIGLHFRGEQDWLQEWGSAEQQINFFLEESRRIQKVSSQHINTVYVSCGSQEAIARLRERFSPFGFTVLDKWTILSENKALLDELGAMDFDQKAVVEYEVLLGADYFEGIMMSTMSVLVAYARTIDDEQDFFTDHLLVNSRRTPKQERLWPDNEVPALKGNERTKLLALNVNLDTFDSVP
ncbi:hypothetical protein B0O99DRAFT_616061 [Bisporella sp. PMI_857]|nr:hypothetical protein B0O99DRAFT_616061 [Bisporella sp. PMI_857]